jgi:hypothetical protein
MCCAKRPCHARREGGPGAHGMRVPALGSARTPGPKCVERRQRPSPPGAAGEGRRAMLARQCRPRRRRHRHSRRVACHCPSPAWSSGQRGREGIAMLPPPPTAQCAARPLADAIRSRARPRCGYILEPAGNPIEYQVGTSLTGHFVLFQQSIYKNSDVQSTRTDMKSQEAQA